MKEGDLVTWRNTNDAIHPELGIVVRLEHRGDDDARTPMALVMWTMPDKQGWSPIEMLTALNSPVHGRIILDNEEKLG